MTNIEKFISSTLSSCIPKKEYTASEVKKKLMAEIQILERWFFNADPEVFRDTETWKQKSALLKIKRENLSEVKKEENQ